jgi:hypothetical protein
MTATWDLDLVRQLGCNPVFAEVTSWSRDWNCPVISSAKVGTLAWGYVAPYFVNCVVTLEDGDVPSLVSTFVVSLCWYCVYVPLVFRIPFRVWACRCTQSIQLWSVSWVINYVVPLFTVKLIHPSGSRTAKLTHTGLFKFRTSQRRATRLHGCMRNSSFADDCWIH